MPMSTPLPSLLFPFSKIPTMAEPKEHHHHPNRAMCLSSFLLPLLIALILFPTSPSAYPLCTDLRAPVATNVTLPFCGYNGSSCCDAAADSEVEKQLKSMNISDVSCNSLVKSLLCTKCDPFSADLFTVESKTRRIPVLCNSTLSANSAQSKDSTTDFCSQVWDTCKDVMITNSPFISLSQGSTAPPASSSSSKFTTIWKSKSDFCSNFVGSTGNHSVCFSGNATIQNNTQNPPPLKGLCLERIGNGAYLNMVAHPDGSNRVFLANQEGKIWLATVPEEGSGKMLEFDESNPFLDLSDVVHYDTLFGMMGLAFHPGFTSNGRFFVSYNCDKTKDSTCSGRCSCNLELGCDSTKLGIDNGARPCQYQSVIAEYTAQSSSSMPANATSANPSEVSRIFTMGLPFTNHHAGQILFGPGDGYLYFMMGDGGKNGDPFNFSQNKKSLLGKIMRFDVDSVSNSEAGWGNYSIPNDNPFKDDNELLPEIWALGFRNPWRCSFDSDRPSYFFCADVGENSYEEVDLISKGGNYGWRVYEGPVLFNSSLPLDGNTTLASLNAVFPVMGYNHSVIDDSIARSASITGGYVYRSQTDPCMFGRYLYADLYATHMWAGTESPENSGNYSSTLIPFSCATDSPIPCESVAGSSSPSLGLILSFGEDNNKDVFVLANKGVYRIVRPSRCNYSCPIENVTSSGTPTPAASSSTGWSDHLQKKVLFLFYLFLVAATICL